MAPRAIWKGHLKIAELVCPVALYAAASTRERVSFRTLNRATGNPVRRDYVDVETGDPVPREDQVKGYEIAKDEFVVLTPEEMAEAVPDSDKTLKVEAFIDCADVETAYFDKPYFLAPADRGAEAAFALIREGMAARKAAALARAVLFRRVRSVLIRAQGPGLVANTLNFDYEVRSAREAFAKVPEVELEAEMLDLARHIIKTRSGSFDPRAFEDRYDAALAELVRAKAEGRAIPAPAPSEAPRVVSLLDALRESAGGARAGGAKARKGGKAGSGTTKPGKSGGRKTGGRKRGGDGPAARRKAS